MGAYERLKQLQRNEGNEERNGTDERGVWRSALLIYERNKPALMAARTAEASLGPYRMLHDECAELGGGGILGKHLAQAVYGALEEMWKAAQ